MLCGSGYQWRECVNGEIPIGAVSIPSPHLDTAFIVREHEMRIRSAYIDAIRQKTSLFEILVASNVKNRKFIRDLFEIFQFQINLIFSLQRKWSTR